MYTAVDIDIPCNVQADEQLMRADRNVRVCAESTQYNIHRGCMFLQVLFNYTCSYMHIHREGTDVYTLTVHIQTFGIWKRPLTTHPNSLECAICSETAPAVLYTG